MSQSRLSCVGCQTSVRDDVDVQSVSSLTDEKGRPAIQDMPVEPLDSNRETWEEIFDVMQRFDEKLIDDWRDELQNLLTFAGLFSAVATTFVAVSYAWLSEDSGSTSANTLVYIAGELQSFRISPPFANSTTPPMIQPSFVASPQVITINTLWVTSLSMSLVAALFAMLVQPWLREYRSLGHMSMREAVRLRELRRLAFYAWGVPWIISIIPMLLQMALVIFLWGLANLLKSLNDTVFIPFAIVGGLSFLLLLVTIIAPLFWSTCPYKSPTSFVVLYVVKSASLALLRALPYITFFPTLFVTSLVFRATRFMSLDVRVETWVVQTRRKFWVWWTRILQPLREVPLRFGASGTEYWTSRERAIVRYSHDLDSSALSWVRPWWAEEKQDALSRCLDDLKTPAARSEVAVEWLAQGLNTESWRLKTRRQAWISRDTLKEVEDPRFAIRNLTLLQEILPKEFGSANDFKDRYGPSVLAMLHRMAMRLDAERTFVLWYLQRLEGLRMSQTINPNDDHLEIARLPTSCLFQLLHSSDDAVRDSASLMDLVTWAKVLCAHIQTTSSASGTRRSYPLRQWIDFFELIFCSTALALSEASRTGTEQWKKIKSDCMSCIAALQVLVDSNAGRERVYRLVRASDSWSTDGVPYMTGRAVPCICGALAQLAERGFLRLTELEEEERDVCMRLYENFRLFVQSERDFRGAMEALERFHKAMLAGAGAGTVAGVGVTDQSEKGGFSVTESSSPHDSVMGPPSAFPPSPGDGRRPSVERVARPPGREA